MMERQRTSSPQKYGEDYHKRPLRSIFLSDPEHGSSYILLIEWETGEISWEILTNIMVDFKHRGIFKGKAGG